VSTLPAGVVADGCETNWLFEPFAPRTKPLVRVPTTTLLPLDCNAMPAADAAHATDPATPKFVSNEPVLV